MNRIPIRLPAKSKYHAKRTEGYASRKEAQRAAELELLMKAGEIKDLQKQVSFTLITQDELGRAVLYRADFVYYELVGGMAGQWVKRVEDVKGMRTEVYKLKRRLMWDLLGIEIRET